MEGAKFIPIFCLLQFGIFGYVSSDTRPSDVHLTKSAEFPLEMNNQRTPRQLPSSDSIFPSKNFIESKLTQNNGEPQLFNLGYSVRFENQQNQNLQRNLPKPTNPQQGDIITGTRKQNVEIDIPDGPQGDAPFSSKKEVKKRKIFGSKLSPNSQNFGNSFLESTGQTYVSPTTQKNLEALGQVRDVDYQDNLSELYQQEYTWRNLGPNVKIIRSTEIPTERIETRALNFDHERALSKSEGFGFSDAIRDENFEKNNFPVREKTIYKHIEKIPSTTEDFRVIQVQEQINEPPVRPHITTASGAFSTNKNVEKEPSFQIVHQPLKLVPQTQVVQLPTTVLKAVPIIPQTKPELIKSQIPKQGFKIQHITIPQIQFEPTPKHRSKYKYIKHIPGGRSNIVYTRKAPGISEYTRNTRFKPEIQREFKPPPLNPRA